MASIITTSYDAAGNIIAPPHGQSEAAWLRFETAVARSESRCSVDGSAVRFWSVGTSEGHACQRGHRWQQTFGTASQEMDISPDWVRVREWVAPACRLAGEAWGEQAFRDATPDSVICPECGSPLTRREYGEEWWHDTPATDGEEPLSGSR
ncbi:MAG: hypothetical protein AAB368_03230 [bacterium]